MDFAGLGVASLATDPSTGDLIVSDAACIRRISQAGEVSWIAGGGAFDDAGNLYVVDGDNDLIRKVLSP